MSDEILKDISKIYHDEDKTHQERGKDIYDCRIQRNKAKARRKLKSF